jgi:hypothetical protein
MPYHASPWAAATNDDLGYVDELVFAGHIVRTMKAFCELNRSGLAETIDRLGEAHRHAAED